MRLERYESSSNFQEFDDIAEKITGSKGKIYVSIDKNKLATTNNIKKIASLREIKSFFSNALKTNDITEDQINSLENCFNSIVTKYPKERYAKIKKLFDKIKGNKNKKEVIKEFKIEIAKKKGELLIKKFYKETEEIIDEEIKAKIKENAENEAEVESTEKAPTEEEIGIENKNTYAIIDEESKAKDQEIKSNIEENEVEALLNEENQAIDDEENEPTEKAPTKEEIELEALYEKEKQARIEKKGKGKEKKVNFKEKDEVFYKTDKNEIKKDFITTNIQDRSGNKLARTDINIRSGKDEDLSIKTRLEKMGQNYHEKVVWLDNDELADNKNRILTADEIIDSYEKKLKTEKFVKDDRETLKFWLGIALSKIKPEVIKNFSENRTKDQKIIDLLSEFKQQQPLSISDIDFAHGIEILIKYFNEL